MKAKIELFSALLRDIEAEIGARDLATLTMDALRDSIKALKVKNRSEFEVEFSKVFELIAKTEPRFGILNYCFDTLKNEFDKTLSTNWKDSLVNSINEILKHRRKQGRQVCINAEELDVEGKTILIHVHSHSVHDVLIHYKKMGRRFKVVIAEQDFEKTHDNIEVIHNAQIPFQVIPTYMISHVMDNIDMVFFGALTLKDTFEFVMEPGTHSVASEFHAANVPMYMFIDTNKFSLWKSKKRGEIFIHKHTRSHCSKPIEYERIKYSHDRVPAKIFSKIVTNEGVFDADGIVELFNEKFKKANSN